MREIKFRAWDKKNKVMIYDGHSSYDYEHYKGNHVEVETFTVPVNTSSEHKVVELYWDDFEGVKDGDAYFRDDVEIMQYIGLKDKNGKEIYEGDIVKFMQYDQREADGFESKKYEFISVVEYEYDSFSFDNACYGEDCVGYEETEVIGNIYENPELLEEPNEQA